MFLCTVNGTEHCYAICIRKPTENPLSNHAVTGQTQMGRIKTRCVLHGYTGTPKRDGSETIHDRIEILSFNRNEKNNKLVMNAVCPYMRQFVI